MKKVLLKKKGKATIHLLRVNAWTGRTQVIKDAYIQYSKDMLTLQITTKEGDLYTTPANVAIIEWKKKVSEEEIKKLFGEKNEKEDRKEEGTRK